MIIQVNITQAMMDRAVRQAENTGKRPNSITKGKGNLAGALGEQMFLSRYGGVHVGEENYDYDVLLNGKRYEMKTKNTTVPPQIYYSCSVSDVNIKQQADYYVFCRVNVSKGIGWILGAYPKKDYFNIAVRLDKGDYDPDNDYTVKGDCWNVQVSDLMDTDRIVGYMDKSQLRLF